MVHFLQLTTSNSNIEYLTTTSIRVIFVDTIEYRMYDYLEHCDKTVVEYWWNWPHRIQEDDKRNHNHMKNTFYCYKTKFTCLKSLNHPPFYKFVDSLSIREHQKQIRAFYNVRHNSNDFHR